MPWTGTQNTTIHAGQSVSDAVDLAESRAAAIAVPVGWTAAGLSFQVSDDGQTFLELADSSGALVSIAQANVAADRLIMLDPAIFSFVRWLKVRSGTAAAAVNQAVDRALTLMTVPR